MISGGEEHGCHASGPIGPALELLDNFRFVQCCMEGWPIADILHVQLFVPQFQHEYVRL